MLRVWQTIRRRFVASGADRATGYAILGNATALVMGPVTVLLVVAHFTPQLQGYYYTFGSLLALRFLADLGLAQVIVQLASHESATIHGRGSIAIAAALTSMPRLAALCGLAVRWYVVAVLVATPTIWLAGYSLFDAAQSSTHVWFMPWAALCLVAGASLLLGPLFAILQGCGEVVQFWRYRLVHQLIANVSLWVGISSGLELWSAAFSVGVALCWSLVFLAKHYSGAVYAIILSAKMAAHAPLRSQVWKLQWRTCVTWMSATFMGQSLIPIVFAVNGPADAGRIGLTVTLVTIVQGFAVSWVVTKAPRFGALVAMQEQAVLRREFAAAMRSCVSIALLLSALASSALFVLDGAGIEVVSRLLAPLPTSVMVHASVGGAATAALSAFLRAHKKEPLAPVYFCTAALVVVMTLSVGATIGVDAVAFGYLAVVSFVQLPWAVLVFRRETRTSGDCVVES